jgi:hypothetical protein
MISHAEVRRRTKDISMCRVILQAGKVLFLNLGTWD